MIALNPEHDLKTAAFPMRARHSADDAESPLASPAAWTSALHRRYAVKKYDPSRHIDPETWAALEESLVLAPSSGGLQPWKFLIVDDPAVRARLLEASYGQTQITEADRLVVLTARADVTAEDVDRFIDRTAEIRGVPVESLAGLKGMLTGITARPEAARADWAARQVYIALGGLLAAAAALGVDATPMEGFDPARYDAILGLRERGYRAMVAVPLGYRSPEDKYAALPKVRFAHAEVVEHV